MTGVDSGDVDEALRVIGNSSQPISDSAWRLVHHTFHPQLRAYATSLAPSLDDADDAMLETWTRIFRAAGAGKLPVSGGSFAAYLLRICRNYLIDRRRFDQRHPRIPYVEMDEGSPETELDTRPAAAIFREFSEALSGHPEPPDEAEFAAARRVLIDRLSPPDATLYTMYVSGSSIAEIAEDLNLSREAVDTRLSRLRKRLKGLAEALVMYKLYRSADEEV